MTAPPTGSVLGIDPADHTPHPLHRADSEYPNVNCIIDTWIEILHARRLPPEAMLSLPLTATMFGDQWRLLEPSAMELELLYGLHVTQIPVWRPLTDHVAEQLRAGRLVLLEVDEFWLPHVPGYQRQHNKTVIAVDGIDVAARSATYVHMTGVFGLSGQDFDATLGWRDYATGLPPFAQAVELDCAVPADLTRRSVDLLTARSAQARALRNHPVDVLANRLAADADYLSGTDERDFTAYVYNGLRQFTGGAQLLAACLAWLYEPSPTREDAIAALRTVATGGDGLHFALARLQRGRTARTGEVLDRMRVGWDAALDAIESLVAVRPDEGRPDGRHAGWPGNAAP